MTPQPAGPEAAVDEILDIVRDAPRAVVLVDGGSGAGKSVFASRLADEWGRRLGQEPQVVRLDDIYPGWDGLAAGSAAVTDTVLRARDPGFTRWDWVHGVPGEWVSIEADRPVIIEGCGAITRESAPLATVRVWLDVPADERKRRALTRDGAGYEPHWDRWAAQEEQHWRKNHSWALSDVLVEPTAGQR